MTPRFPLSRLSVRSLCLLLLVAVVSMSGCSSIKGMFKKDKDANEGVPVEQLYDKSYTSIINGNWTGAVIA